MKIAYSFAEIRAAEQRAIGEGTDVSTLMERAGTALAEAVLERAKTSNVADILFVCGGGNNGGDGFVAAQILLEKGLDVTVLCMAEHFSPPCAEAKSRFHGEVLGRMPRRLYPFAVDCLFGTGLNRAPDGVNAELISLLNRCGYVLSCDVPSGLSEGGVAEGPCVHADCTVTFGGLKQALLLADGADCSGEVISVDIGLSPEGGAEVWEDGDISPFFPPKKSHSNKGDYGTAVILSTCNILGAPLLAAGAALKSGAGYTDLYMTSSSLPCDDASRLSSFHMADELHRVLCAVKYPACRFSFYDGEPIFAEAVAFGMGAGVGGTTRSILEELFSSCRGVLVLDADALNTLAVSGLSLLKRRECPVVVTPHIKEFSRLTGKTIEDILKDPVGCARAFALEYGVTVVLKNNRTVITDGTKTAINTAGSPVLSKGGSGDVLAGFLAGTIARGVSPFEAAVLSCHVCGRAGELAAKKMGEYAPSPEDIIGFLPLAMQ